jgi:gamma-glutamylcyclotransferase (GGCT)/AIG2-like uncharacterized protein YtfP
MGRSKRSKNKYSAKKKEQKLQHKLMLSLKKKVNRKMEKRYLVGIYDSFRKGGIYHNKINTANSKLIGSYSTQPIYNMYDVGVDDVIIVKDGNHSIKIEVWEVSEKTLTTLEKEYNYYPELEQGQNLYLKETVSSPFGDILLYTYDDTYDATDMIILGDWIEHLNILKAKRIITTPTTNYMRNGYDKIMNSSEFAIDKEFMD